MRRKNSPPTKSPSTWPGSALLLIAILYVQCKPGSCPEGTGAAPWLWREASVASYVRKSYNAKDNIMPAAASCPAIKELCPSGESTVPCLEQGKKRHAEGGPKSFRLRKPGHFHVGWCLMAVTSSGLWVWVTCIDVLRCRRCWRTSSSDDHARSCRLACEAIVELPAFALTPICQQLASCRSRRHAGAWLARRNKNTKTTQASCLVGQRCGRRRLYFSTDGRICS